MMRRYVLGVADREEQEGKREEGRERVESRAEKINDPLRTWFPGAVVGLLCSLLAGAGGVPGTDPGERWGEWRRWVDVLRLLVSRPL
jgi:hypothetical protein